MSSYIYGKDLTFQLYTFEDKTAIPTLPAQTVTGYVFTEAPSRSQAKTGSGSLSTFTKILSGSEAFICTVPAISDPYPEDAVQFRVYWVAVNFIVATSKQVQTVIRAIKVERVSAQDSRIGVTVETLEAKYPTILSYTTTEELQATIDLATIDLVDDLTNKGFDWNKIYHPDQLFNALLVRSLESFYTSQINRDGDKFTILASKAGQRYQSIINSLKLDYDSSFSDQPIEKKKTGGIIWNSR